VQAPASPALTVTNPLRARASASIRASVGSDALDASPRPSLDLRPVPPAGSPPASAAAAGTGGAGEPRSGQGDPHDELVYSAARQQGLMDSGLAADEQRAFVTPFAPTVRREAARV
jgi:hypothetical protein